MGDDVHDFVVDALKQMNYDVSGITRDTELGPAGLNLESLAVAELIVLAEDRLGVVFTDDEAEQLGSLTVGELAAELARRIVVPAGGTAE
jgi:acyl carrier protein